ncbi:DUF2069 domain-containing protein [Gallaecimonas xiamenensis]|uniref:DUF2069 domain-containing protein n=1 Tax=Gallaecimonas xiamenensis 3-C-1 TaxID=745411 RepID=K2JNW0_9GAMM|nr:DUF2069 domain-containing protein [Gallaecimonas xiamenensis]EKE76177.1 hypothetical protein B3C1_04695 [Gallaecimonas xiamenensis 3-C-1]
MKPAQPHTQRMRYLALAGYLGLLCWVPLWRLWLAPHPQLSAGFLLALWFLPLLLPLKGILKGNPYTYAWANFLVLLYLTHSLTLLWVSPAERWLAAVELIFTLMMLTGGVFYARWRGKELDLGLKKNQPH